MTTSIKLTDVCRYYKDLPHQNTSLDWLQGKVAPNTVLEFTRRWRQGQYGLGISFVNVAKFYEAQKHQADSLEWLQSQIDAKVLEDFAALWRSGPPPVVVSSYYTQMTHNGTRQPESAEHKANIGRMVQELEALEKHLGVPLVLTSGYRPEPINAQVGGVPGSQHTLGKAADFYSPQMDDFELERKVIEYWYDGGKGGVGRGMSYRGFVHIDTGTPRIWDY